jgi:hypothetical protein
LLGRLYRRPFTAARLILALLGGLLGVVRLRGLLRLPAVGRSSTLAALQFFRTRFRFRLRGAVGWPLLANGGALDILGRGRRGLGAGTFLALLRHIRLRLRDDGASANEEGDSRGTKPVDCHGATPAFACPFY